MLKYPTYFRASRTSCSTYFHVSRVLRTLVSPVPRALVLRTSRTLVSHVLRVLLALVPHLPLALRAILRDPYPLRASSADLNFCVPLCSLAS